MLKINHYFTVTALFDVGYLVIPQEDEDQKPKGTNEHINASKISLLYLNQDKHEVFFKNFTHYILRLK